MQNDEKSTSLHTHIAEGCGLIVNNGDVNAALQCNNSERVRPVAVRPRTDE